MGHCLGKEGASRRGNYQKFEFTPKSSWRYKDSRMLSELEQSNGDPSSDTPTTMVNENAADHGSDDELNIAGTVSTRRSAGRLVFSEDDTSPRPNLSKKSATAGHMGNSQEEALYTAPSSDGNGNDEEDVRRTSA